MSREKSGILIMIDDQPTDLADVTWVEIAPCGCTSGAKAAPLASFTISDCPHIPKWGYERPTPPDMKWAASKWGRGSKGQADCEKCIAAASLQGVLL